VGHGSIGAHVCDAFAGAQSAVCSVSSVRLAPFIDQQLISSARNSWHSCCRCCYSYDGNWKSWNL